MGPSNVRTENATHDGEVTEMGEASMGPSNVRTENVLFAPCVTAVVTPASMGPSNVRTENSIYKADTRRIYPLQWGRPMLGRKTRNAA